MSEPSTRLREALVHRDETGTDALLRALVSHVDWLVPTEALGSLLLDARTVRMVHFGDETKLPDGELWVYGDREMGHEALAGGARLGTYAADVWGADLFACMSDEVRSLRVNPLAAQEVEVVLGMEERGDLRSLASAVRLEADFAGAVNGLSPSVARRLRGYDAYLIMRDERHGPMLSRDAELGLTRAVAAFSAADSAKAYASGLSVEAALHLHVDQVDGVTLFGEIVGAENDGVVINPLGPGARLALPRSRTRALA